MRWRWIEKLHSARPQTAWKSCYPKGISLSLFFSLNHSRCDDSMQLFHSLLPIIIPTINFMHSPPHLPICCMSLFVSQHHRVSAAWPKNYSLSPQKWVETFHWAAWWPLGGRKRKILLKKCIKKLSNLWNVAVATKKAEKISFLSLAWVTEHHPRRQAAWGIALNAPVSCTRLKHTIELGQAREREWNR